MTMRGELVLLDTTILLTATDESRPGHRTALHILSESITVGVHLATSGQIVREYLVAATRPCAQNGFGLRPEDALHNLKQFKKRMVFLEETEPVCGKLIELVGQHSISGKQVHDANLAALISIHAISALVTLNPEDFSHFSELNVVSLNDFAARLRG